MKILDVIRESALTVSELLERIRAERRLCTHDGKYLLYRELTNRIPPSRILPRYHPERGTCKYIDYYVDYGGGCVVKVMVIPRGMASRTVLAYLLGRKRKGESGLAHFFDRSGRDFYCDRVAVVFTEKMRENYMDWYLDRIAPMVSKRRGAYLLIAPVGRRKVFLVHLGDVAVRGDMLDYREYL